MKNFYSKLSVLSVITFIFFSLNIKSQTTVKPIVRLFLNTTAFNDETVFYFEQGGTADFQGAFDAYKLLYGNNPYLASLSGTVLTSINGLPALPVNLNIPVKAITNATGSFTFSAAKEDFPDGVCVTLYDAFTGISSNILTSNYVCTLYDTTTIARFNISFFTTTVNITSLIKQAECHSPNGIIVVNGDGMFNFEWKNDLGVVRSSLNKMVGDTLPNLNGGTYSLNVTTAAGCGNFSTSFVMDQVITPIASFSSDLSSNILSTSQEVNFTNNSTNAQSSAWDFGDNSGTWYNTNPSHQYLTPGTYTVTLNSESIHHCKDQTQKVITVVDGLTGIHSLSQNSDIKLSTLSQGVYSINFTNDVQENYTISLVNLNGTLLKTIQLEQVQNVNESIDLSSLSSGMYLLNVNNHSNPIKTFKLIK
jgi:PKD repeat protein